MLPADGKIEFRRVIWSSLTVTLNKKIFSKIEMTNSRSNAEIINRLRRAI